MYIDLKIIYFILATLGCIALIYIIITLSNLNKLIKNQKKSIIQLWVFKDNIKAIKLYKNLGFEIIKETKKRYLMEIN